MAGTFDPYDKKSWYFGPISRRGAEELLNQEEIGVFLVRNSTTSQGDLVLCVREDEKVSHYIIHKIQQHDQTRFRIGDQIFPDIPALLHYYKDTPLDTATLKRPIERPQQVKALYDFSGRDEDDLPFRKGEVLTILSKDEDQWWTARNTTGQMGSIPVPYVTPYISPEDDNLTCEVALSAIAQQPAIIDSNNDMEGINGGIPDGMPGNGRQTNGLIGGSNGQESSSPPLIPSLARSQVKNRHTVPASSNADHPQQMGRLSQPHLHEQGLNRAPHIEHRLPAKARVIQEKVPNAYDRTALRLHVGDVITVTKTNINGQWEGELNGKFGHFPFTHVTLLEEEEDESAPVSSET